MKPPRKRRSPPRRNGRASATALIPITAARACSSNSPWKIRASSPRPGRRRLRISAPSAPNGKSAFAPRMSSTTTPAIITPTRTRICRPPTNRISERSLAGCADLRKSDPAAAPGHAEPQHQRYDRHRSAQPRPIGSHVCPRHAAANREGEYQHQKQRRHLYPEGKAVKRLDRFRHKKRNSRRETQNEAGDQERLGVCREQRNRLATETHAQ